MRRHVHTEIVTLRWGDMDAMGHVNNTLYFRYMEQARIGFYERLGVRESLPPNCGPVVVTSNCVYRRALVYPGDVEVKVFVSDPGRTSVMTHYELRPSYDPGELYAEGTAKACWIDTVKGRAILLPPPVRALFETREAP